MTRGFVGCGSKPRVQRDYRLEIGIRRPCTVVGLMFAWNPKRQLKEIAVSHTGIDLQIGDRHHIRVADAWGQGWSHDIMRIPRVLEMSKSEYVAQFMHGDGQQVYLSRGQAIPDFGLNLRVAALISIEKPIVARAIIVDENTVACSQP